MLDTIYHALNPIAFSVGPFEVHWYGLSYIVGFFFAALLIWRMARRWQIELSIDALLTVIIACMLGAVIGGRLGYVLIYGNGYYFQNPAEILAFSKGGMSFHGGMVGLALGLVIAARVIKMPLMSIGDLASIATPAAIICVRIANFVNGELWGAVTDLPWGVIFDATGGGALPRHPSQLYEALSEGLLLLIVLYFLARKRPPLPRGSYFSIFLIGYGCCRIAVEFVRQPDIQMGYLFNTNWITTGMTLSLPMVIGGLIYLVYSLRRKAPQYGQEWQRQFPGFVAAEAGSEDANSLAGSMRSTGGSGLVGAGATNLTGAANQTGADTNSPASAGQLHAGADTQAGTDSPADTDSPAGTDTQAGTDSPADTDSSVGADTQAGTDSPADTDSPAGRDTPTGVE